MDLPAIAPRWARLAIIPAVIAFGLFTVGLTLLFALVPIREPEVFFGGGWILVLGGVPIVWFFATTTYRGLDLCRFRNHCAALHWRAPRKLESLKS